MEWATMTANEATREKMLTIVIGGGGPTGVEMAGALAELRKYVLPKDYPNVDFSKMKIYIVEGSDQIACRQCLRNRVKEQKNILKKWESF